MGNGDRWQDIRDGVEDSGNRWLLGTMVISDAFGDSVVNNGDLWSYEYR